MSFPYRLIDKRLCPSHSSQSTFIRFIRHVADPSNAFPRWVSIDIPNYNLVPAHQRIAFGVGNGRVAADYPQDAEDSLSLAGGVVVVSEALPAKQ
jgi:hypothetical protein